MKKLNLFFLRKNESFKNAVNYFQKIPNLTIEMVKSDLIAIGGFRLFKNRINPSKFLRKIYLLCVGKLAKYIFLEVQITNQTKSNINNNNNLNSD